MVQGQKDIQVKVEDAALLHQARPSATYLLIENMNHVLKSVVSNSRTDNIKTYSDPTLPISATLVQGVTHFIQPIRTFHK